MTLQTARYRSGHPCGMTFGHRTVPASPAHLLDCWGISLGQLFGGQNLEIIIASDELYCSFRLRAYEILEPQSTTATPGSDLVQSGPPIFDDIFQHLWPYIGNNTANVVFQMVKRLWLIRIDQ
ncbi:hypothetical protein TNCV_3820301 [Trichonephila clavipes]|uniref:Uncharacterized protein n=1 Tax=Trichonephila clavipes TaxID=2585209 RepID=A0A8X6RBG1_TRICX|nr:hypothetical protein TNCV_3820301 [Trichonephila clavipes]